MKTDFCLCAFFLLGGAFFFILAPYNAQCVVTETEELDWTNGTVVIRVHFVYEPRETIGESVIRIYRVDQPDWVVGTLHNCAQSLILPLSLNYNSSMVAALIAACVFMLIGILILTCLAGNLYDTIKLRRAIQPLEET